MKHEYAFQPVTRIRDGARPLAALPLRVRGEYHLLNPMTVCKLQHAVRQTSFETFQEYTSWSTIRIRQLSTVRGLLEIQAAKKPIPLDEVEPAPKS